MSFREDVRSWLAEDGISSEILGRVPERGSIIARVEGRKPDARLMFMSHTDVVPVEGSVLFPPIPDGWVAGAVEPHPDEPALRLQRWRRG